MTHLPPSKTAPASHATLCGISMVQLFASGEPRPSPRGKKTDCPKCEAARG